MKIVSKILLFFVFGLALSKANITPLLSISSYNINGYLIRDEIIVDSRRPSQIEGGILTARSGRITIRCVSEGRYLLEINSIISDNGKQRVGVDLVRDDGGQGHTGVSLNGSESNNFTGDFNVKGMVKLNLSKMDGVIAISGDLNIVNGGEVRLIGNEQINNSSRVLLKSGVNGPSYIYFNAGFHDDVTETFYQLTVDGVNIFDFGCEYEWGHKHGIRKLILDDLEILDGGHLEIRSWANQRDFLLVRKDSKHLQDALKKLNFSGQPNRVYLVDYNKDYWEVSNAPEPAVYGAVIGTLGVGLAIQRRKWLRVPA